MHKSFLFVSVSVLAVFAASSVIAQTPPASPAPTPATGQESPTNQPVKSEQHGDWVLSCNKLNAQTPQTCELVQTITLNGQKAPFAQIAIGRPKADMPIQLTVLVPQNVSFPSVVKVYTDDKDRAPLDVAWARCMPMGCFANIPMKEDVQKRWSSLETQGRVIFKAGNGQDIAIPISFKGLKGAIEALSKEK